MGLSRKDPTMNNNPQTPNAPKTTSSSQNPSNQNQNKPQKKMGSCGSGNCGCS